MRQADGKRRKQFATRVTVCEKSEALARAREPAGQLVVSEKGGTGLPLVGPTESVAEWNALGRVRGSKREEKEATNDHISSE